MTTINTWTDREGILRCDRTERTDRPAAATVVISHIGSTMLGRNAYCMPPATDKRLVEIRFLGQGSAA